MLDMTENMEVYRHPRQPSRMYQLSVVFDRAVASDPADGEGPWVAARPKGFWQMLAPFEKQHSLLIGFAS